MHVYNNVYHTELYMCTQPYYTQFSAIIEGVSGPNAVQLQSK